MPTQQKQQTQQQERTYSMREIIEAQHKISLPISEYVFNKKRFPFIILAWLILQLIFPMQYSLAILTAGTYGMYKSMPLQIDEKDGNLIYIATQYVKKTERWFYRKVADMIEKYMQWY